MKRSIYFCLLVLCSACTYHFETDEIRQPAKLVLYAFPGDCDTTFIQLSKSVPVNQVGKREIQVSDADIVFRVNGEEKAVKRLGEDDSFTGKARYFVEGKFHSGDRIRIDASVTGLAPVTSQTEVPVLCRPEKIQLVKKASADGFGPTLEFLVTFRDNPSSADYYGVKVELMEEHWRKNTPFEPFYSCNVFNMELGTGEEPLLNRAGSLDDLFFVYDHAFSGLYVFPDDKINGREYTLHLNTGYVRVDEDSDPDAYDPYFYHYYYRLTFFSLSRDYYLYMKNLIDAGNNKLGEAGLSPVRPTYTNVENGLGIAGAYRMYRTEWLKFRDNE